MLRYLFTSHFWACQILSILLLALAITLLNIFLSFSLEMSQTPSFLKVSFITYVSPIIIPFLEKISPVFTFYKSSVSCALSSDSFTPEIEFFDVTNSTNEVIGGSDVKCPHPFTFPLNQVDTSSGSQVSECTNGKLVIVEKWGLSTLRYSAFLNNSKYPSCRQVCVNIALLGAYLNVIFINELHSSFYDISINWVLVFYTLGWLFAFSIVLNYLLLRSN